jgi:nicotinamide-nucleotide amidase
LILNSSNPTVGVLALPGQVDVRVAAKAANRDEALRLIAPLEAEVRGLLGGAVFAVDDETMENVVGKLLQVKDKSVAVYEDLTCGQLAERLQMASAEHFGAGFISNGKAATRALLKHGRHPERIDACLQDPVALTDELAWAARQEAGSDLGLALHAIPDPASTIQNLARGETYVALTDGNRFLRRMTTTAGRSAHDRTRMVLNAIDLLRTALTEGIP